MSFCFFQTDFYALIGVNALGPAGITDVNDSVCD